MASLLSDWLRRRRNALPAPPADLLAVFLRHFLSPVAADGRMAGEEETPLCIAYHALHIHDVERLLPPGQLEARCREAIYRPMRQPAQEDTESALGMLSQCANRVSALEWLTLVRWVTAGSGATPTPGHTGFRIGLLRRESIRGLRALLARVWRQSSDREIAIAGPVPPPDDPGAPVQPDTAPAPTEPPTTLPLSEPDSPVFEIDADPEACERIVSGRLETELRARAQSLTAALRAQVAGAWRPWLAFDTSRESVSEKAVLVEGDVGDLWFIGDVHGDLLALECALAYISGEDPGAVMLFLGDLIDDGPFSFEVLLRVIDLTLTQPRRVALLPGNHDEALSLDRQTGRYSSNVVPSDFAECLNGHSASPPMRDLADAFILLVGILPRALFFRDGLLAAHGGIPQRDLWENGGLASRQDLDAPLCLQDFVWTRAHPRARRRLPDRYSRGAEFGIEDFNAFCERASAVLGRPVERMVRGHDHIPERYSVYAGYRRHRIVTINTLASRLSRELTGPFERVPCVARYRPGALPEVHRIRIPGEAIRAVHERTSRREQS